MTQKIHTIQILNPCQQKWAGMEVSPGGRFCSTCEKEVIDFTDFSNTELINYFLKNKISEGCGKFLRSQTEAVKIPIDVQIFQSNTAQWKKFLILLLCCFGRELFNAEVVFGQTVLNDSNRISLRSDSTPVSDTIELKDTSSGEETKLTEECAEVKQTVPDFDLSIKFSLNPVPVNLEFIDSLNVVMGGFVIYPEHDMDIFAPEKTEDTGGMLPKDSYEVISNESATVRTEMVREDQSTPDKLPRRKEGESKVPFEAILVDNDPKKKRAK